MSELLRNVTLDRLFRHMAWANSYLLKKLSQLSTEELALGLPDNDWNVGAITEHFVRSAGFYVRRLGGEIETLSVDLPLTPSDLGQLQERSARYDEQLREESLKEEAILVHERDGQTIRRARSTILGQSIHHAIEHRAQIADILVFHKITIIDLDEIDVWGLGDAEGMGE